MKYILIVFICLTSSTLFGQQTDDLLLTKQNIQIECTEAVDALYNFKFDVARKQFNWLKQQYPEHPLPYFLLGLEYWWRIMPNDENESYDDRFYEYMDSTITFAEKLYEQNPKNPEATFFLAGAYGFKGRLYSDRGHYTRATFAARKALEYLNENLTKSEDLHPEFMLGKALYNYFREWIPDNKKFLKPVVMFFPKGDKKLGLEQLNSVATHSFYARIEAMTFQLMIYSDYESKKETAYPIAKYLIEKYPDNAYFHRFYAKICFVQGYINDCEKYSLSLLDKIDKKLPGYEANGGRYASYFLGYIHQKIRGDKDKAAYYYAKSVEFGKQQKAFTQNYFLFSLVALAEISAEKGDVNKAIKYFEEVEEYAEKDHEAYKTAKEYLKKHRKKSKSFFGLF